MPARLLPTVLTLRALEESPTRAPVNLVLLRHSHPRFHDIAANRLSSAFSRHNTRSSCCLPRIRGYCGGQSSSLVPTGGENPVASGAAKPDHPRKHETRGSFFELTQSLRPLSVICSFKNLGNHRGVLEEHVLRCCVPYRVRERVGVPIPLVRGIRALHIPTLSVPENTPGLQLFKADLRHLASLLLRQSKHTVVPFSRINTGIFPTDLHQQQRKPIPNTWYSNQDLSRRNRVIFPLHVSRRCGWDCKGQCRSW